MTSPRNIAYIYGKHATTPVRRSNRVWLTRFHCWAGYWNVWKFSRNTTQHQRDIVQTSAKAEFAFVSFAGSVAFNSWSCQIYRYTVITFAKCFLAFKCYIILACWRESAENRVSEERVCRVAYISRWVLCVMTANNNLASAVKDAPKKNTKKKKLKKSNFLLLVVAMLKKICFCFMNLYNCKLKFYCFSCNMN